MLSQLNQGAVSSSQFVQLLLEFAGADPGLITRAAAGVVPGPSAPQPIAAPEPVGS